MKCVCPMGGDRTCPDDCPLAVWQGLSVTDRKAQRKPVAERLYKQGFTMEAIATQLSVHHSQIVRDLKEFVHDAQIKPAKSASNPKGAGRPKGSTKPKGRSDKYPEIQERAAAKAILDDGKTHAQVRANTGMSDTVLRRAVAKEEGRREPQVDRADLSITAQRKLDAAINQYKRKLAAEFETRVLAEVRKRIDEIILPGWKKRVEQASNLYKHRRGAMDKATFNKIRRALHPDSRQSISDAVLADAFDTFMGLEKYLLDEKNSPTDLSGLPDTLADWDRMRAQTAHERRQKRNIKNPLRMQ